MSSKKSKHRKPQAAPVEPSPDPVATTQESTPAAAAPPRSSWRTRALIAAGVLVVGTGGVLAGRASMSGSTPADTPTVAPSGVPTAEAKETWPPAFEITPDPKWPGGAELRPMDRDIFDKLITLNLERLQMRDVFPDRPYRVQFLGSLVERNIGAVAIDLDRDGTMDERWEIKQGSVTRKVQKDPATGGTSVTYLLTHGHWKPH